MLEIFCLTALHCSAIWPIITLNSVSSAAFCCWSLFLLIELAFKFGDVRLTLGVYLFKLFEFLLGVIFLLDGLGDLLFDEADFAEDGGLFFTEPFNVLFEQSQF